MDVAVWEVKIGFLCLGWLCSDILSFLAKSCSWRHPYVSQSDDLDESKMGGIVSPRGLAPSAPVAARTLGDNRTARAQIPPLKKVDSSSDSTTTRSSPRPEPVTTGRSSPRSAGVEPIQVASTGTTSPRNVPPIPVKLGSPRRNVSGPATLISSRSPPAVKKMDLDEMVNNMSDDLDGSFF